MKKRICRFAICVVCSVVLLVSSVSADIMTNEERYQIALSQLNAYLSQDTNVDLDVVIQEFTALIGYKESSSFLFYSQAMRSLQSEELNAVVLQGYMGPLTSDEYLSTLLLTESFRKEYPYIRSFKELSDYVSARLSEQRWNMEHNSESLEEALGLYQGCLNFYDAAVRYTKLFQVSINRNKTEVQSITQVTAEPTMIPCKAVEISDVLFPDKTFRNIVSRFDVDKDGVLDESELSAVQRIECSGQGISTLRGIEYFVALQELNCSENRLSELDISKNPMLQYLDIYKNRIQEIDLSNNTELVELRMSSNRISQVDLSHNTKLETLFCNSNDLSTIDTSNNPNLIALECADNHISALDLGNNPLLERLKCCMNPVKNIDISHCEYLIIAKTKGTHIDSSYTLYMIYQVPGRNAVVRTQDKNTIRDRNCYCVLTDLIQNLIVQ